MLGKLLFCWFLCWLCCQFSCGCVSVGSSSDGAEPLSQEAQARASDDDDLARGVKDALLDVECGIGVDMGLDVGGAVGELDGLLVGSFDGFADGDSVGGSDGGSVGGSDGLAVGLLVGSFDGFAIGESVEPGYALLYEDEEGFYAVVFARLFLPSVNKMNHHALAGKQWPAFWQFAKIR
jgi:hypothetical protein